MKNKFRHVAFALALPLCMLFPSSANAGCDACITGAVNSANSSMVNILNQIASSVQSNVAATNALNSTVISVSAALQTTLNVNHELLMQGLSASTNRIELAIQQNTKTAELLNDHLVKSLTQVLTDLRVSEEVSLNNRTFDNDLAQPVSGDIGANRAPLLKEGEVQRAQLKTELTKDMFEWVTKTEVDNDARNADGLRMASLLSEDDEVWDPTAFIGSTIMTDEEFKNAQKLLTVLVTPVPVRELTNHEKATMPNAHKYEVERKLYNIQATLAHSVLSNSLVDRLPLIPISEGDWKKGYVTAESNDEGKTSMLALMESETLGRLTSEGWYQDVKTKTEAGVLREQVYMQAVRNKLALKMLKQEEERLMLEALKFARETREKMRETELMAQ